jgi:hypothetical protein
VPPFATRLRAAHRCPLDAVGGRVGRRRLPSSERTSFGGNTPAWRPLPGGPPRLGISTQQVATSRRVDTAGPAMIALLVGVVVLRERGEFGQHVAVSQRTVMRIVMHTLRNGWRDHNSREKPLKYGLFLEGPHLRSPVFPAHPSRKPHAKLWQRLAARDARSIQSCSRRDTIAAVAGFSG